MYFSTVLFAKHSSQYITLLALKSCWCSSKVFVCREHVQSSGSSLCRNKDEPLLMRLVWETTSSKEYCIYTLRFISLKKSCWNTNLLYPCYPTQINYIHKCSKHPLLMAITCPYKGKVETHVLLIKNE